MNYVVIMAGGSGTRFWPRSRKNIPKQCLPITSGKPMIVDTVERLENLAPRSNIYIATGKHLEKPIRSVLPDVNYIIEPMAKNTAACIGLSALKIYAQDKDAIIVIETADHTYSDVESYIRHLRLGIEIAKDNKIVLIGIKPTFPHTGFGYIHQGANLFEEEGINIFEISEFREKPELKVAKEFLESNDYLWNSGIFISKADTMLKALKDYMPHLYNSLMQIKESNFDENILKQEFQSIDSISIDYGVMEKAENTVVIRGEFPWDDVGDWKAMERILPKDHYGNIIIGKHSGDARNCIILCESLPIETEGIEDLIIIDTKDCLLVCDKERYNEVKKIVEILEKDPSLSKYAIDLQDNYEFNNISIDCESLDINSTGIVATIGIDNLYIEKNLKIIIKAN